MGKLTYSGDRVMSPSAGTLGVHVGDCQRCHLTLGSEGEAGG